MVALNPFYAFLAVKIFLALETHLFLDLIFLQKEVFMFRYAVHCINPANQKLQIKMAKSDDELKIFLNFAKRVGWSSLVYKID